MGIMNCGFELALEHMEMYPITLKIMNVHELSDVYDKAIESGTLEEFDNRLSIMCETENIQGMTSTLIN